MDEDEVIREVDVVLCDYPGLFLAQLPLKPVYAEPLSIQSARFKPDNRVLELKVPLFKPPGSDSHADMDGQRYISSEVVPSFVSGAGFISNNTMYISPVDGILQMRPNLKQFHDLKTENIEISMDMDMDVDDEDEHESSAPVPANNHNGMQQVQLKRKETERAQSARMQSYSFLKHQEEAEPWKNLHVHVIGKRPPPIFVVEFC